jgi:hypothetical protein
VWSLIRVRALAPLGACGGPDAHRRGLDIHRKQITFDCVDTDTGELERGRIAPADRAHLADWLAREVAGRAEVHLAFEGCTGWRYVAEELARAGVSAHLAEPADTAALRGRKRPSSDGKRSPGHLSRQGPGVLRWCLYEAAKTHARSSDPTTTTTRKRNNVLTANAPSCPRPARSSGRPVTS